LNATAIKSLKSRGAACFNFATDDPLNPVFKAEWFLRSLCEYDAVFTPRKSNIAELRRLGCRNVHYLPFAYDEQLFKPVDVSQVPAFPPPEVLFVGGADADRAQFFASYMKVGVRPTFVGGYWQRYPHTKALALGQKLAATIRQLTAHAAVNICLVRRANRDGHVMRSFEIPAVGGFMIAEDTEEHRGIFGPEGECVLYFKSPEEAAHKTLWAIRNPGERRRMAAAAHSRIIFGGHTYKDRLKAILARTPGKNFNFPAVGSKPLASSGQGSVPGSFLYEGDHLDANA
jgi:spore maturation protein CgeB